MMPYERVLELTLEIVLEGMKGQTPDQKKIMWNFYIEDVKDLRSFLKWLKGGIDDGKSK